jgi:deoxyribonuclease (pyrimidine dimer)
LKEVQFLSQCPKTDWCKRKHSLFTNAVSGSTPESIPLSTMTRINLVRPEDLADQHLFAEWRESKMIVPAALRSIKAGTEKKDISPKYTLNTGHVKFFFNKLYFVRRRFEALGAELILRGYDIKPFDFSNTDYVRAYGQISQDIMWEPTKSEIQINIDRIAQRLNERPDWYRWYGHIMPPSFFIERYNQQLVVDELVG